MTDVPTPPTDPTDLNGDDFDLREPPKWPKVVGIISIVWAGLWLTCTGIGAAFLPFQAKFMEPMLEGAPPPPTMRVTIYDWLLMGAGIVFLVMLLTAGIATLNRKRLGWTLHVVYAACSIPLVVVNAFNQFSKQAGLEQWVKEYPDSPLAQSQTSPGAEIGQTVGLVIMLVIGFGYPLFLLIWFLLVKPKHEQMTGGGEEVY